jgi:hypothetical protein
LIHRHDQPYLPCEIRRAFHRGQRPARLVGTGPGRSVRCRISASQKLQSLISQAFVKTRSREGNQKQESCLVAPFSMKARF